MAKLYRGSEWREYRYAVPNTDKVLIIKPAAGADAIMFAEARELPTLVGAFILWGCVWASSGAYWKDNPERIPEMPQLMYADFPKCVDRRAFRTLGDVRRALDGWFGDGR